MAVLSYPEILNVAQQLPPGDQLELAETLLHNIRAMFSGAPKPEFPSHGLTPLFGVSRAELQALADAVVSADRQQQLHELLERNRQGSLSSEEEKLLEDILAEADQVALLKARALYTIQTLGRSVTSSS